MMDVTRLDHVWQRWRRSVIGRRFVSTAIGALVVLVGAVVVVRQPVSYVSSAVVVFVGAPSVAERAVILGAPVDPLAQSALARTGSTRVVGDIFVRTYRSYTKRQQLAADGLVGRLSVSTRTTVRSDTPDHGPVFVMVVTSHTPEDAVKGASLVLADVGRELIDVQRGSDASLMVQAALATEPTDAVVASGSTTRAAVGFLVLGIAVGTASIPLIDLADPKRRRRRASGVGRPALPPTLD